MATVAAPPAGAAPSAAEPAPLEREAHIKFLTKCLSFLPTPYESLDVNRTMAAMFCLGGLDVLGALDEAVKDKQSIIEWVYGLQFVPGAEQRHLSGFRGGSFVGAKRGEPSDIPYDCSHVTSTYSSLLILLTLGDDLSRVDREAVLDGIKALQQPDGSFKPIYYESESDMRFVYCACVVSHILNDWRAVDKDRVVDYICKSMSYDGGFAQGPLLESHGGSTYCALASLSLMGRLNALPDRERTMRWLLMRQDCGFQGRTNKRADSCYSFWIGASLSILGASQHVDAVSNRMFVCSCQQRGGGIAKYSDAFQDIVHTHLALAGMSLFGDSELQPIDPRVNVTLRALQSLKQTRYWR